MDFGTVVRELVLIDPSQRHGAFDSLGLGQLRGFSFGELKHGPTDAAGLRVTVAPPPVFDESPRAWHGFVFDRTRLDLRQGVENPATFLGRGCTCRPDIEVGPPLLPRMSRNTPARLLLINASEGGDAGEPGARYQKRRRGHASRRNPRKQGGDVIKLSHFRHAKGTRRRPRPAGIAQAGTRRARRGFNRAIDDQGEVDACAATGSGARHSGDQGRRPLVCFNGARRCNFRLAGCRW